MAKWDAYARPLAEELRRVREKWFRSVRGAAAGLTRREGAQDPFSAELAAIAYQLAVVKRLLVRHGIMAEEDRSSFIHDLYRASISETPFLSLAFLRYTSADQEGEQACRNAFVKDEQAILMPDADSLEAYWLLLIEADLLAGETTVAAATLLQESSVAEAERQALAERAEQLRGIFTN